MKSFGSNVNGSTLIHMHKTLSLCRLDGERSEKKRARIVGERGIVAHHDEQPVHLHELHHDGELASKRAPRRRDANALPDLHVML